MAKLIDVISNCECTSTHHKLAIDALRHLRNTQASAWRDLFLRNFDVYLDGSKAPDKKFKDFRNHVLHVGDNYWGGAVKKCREWYAKTVELLGDRKWSQAVYAAGVLSHYYTDPIQPFHTGQSEEEGAVHRAAEWSIAKSYDELREILQQDLGGYPDVETPQTPDWLDKMVVAGAETAHPHYQLLIDHYDLKTGVKDPPNGFDQDAKDCLARLIGYASVGFSRILDRAFEQAAVTPPGGGAGLVGYLARLTIPISWVVRKLADNADRRVVSAIYAEVKKTGRAIKSLPEDDRLIRQLHAKEVLQTSLEELEKQPVQPTGQRFGQGAPERRRKRQEPVERKEKPSRTKSKESGDSRREPSAKPAIRFNPDSKSRRVDGPHETLRFHLARRDPIVDAPSIGNKTARRLEGIGVRTVDDLLSIDAEIAAERIRRGYIDVETIKRWKAEAELVCRVPNLRGHDAQILVGCELTNPDEITLLDPNELLDLVLPFVGTVDGQRILRNMNSPDLKEVGDWIRWSGQARALNAA